MPKAIDGVHNIRSFMTSAMPTASANHKLEFMPGSGVTPWVAQELVERLVWFGLRSIHLSGGCLIPDSLDGIPGDPSEDYIGGKRHTGMLHRPKGMGMGVVVGPDPNEEWMVWRTDEARVRAVRVAIDQTLETIKENVLARTGKV